LGKALERGVTQYVILGAGLDSFAYRHPDLADVVHVFEVDHPATQRWKRGRLRELNLTLPRNLTLVPVDFERQPLADGLRASGHGGELPALVWGLGVKVCVREAAVSETLRDVASLAFGREIVFEYFLPEALLDDENRRRLAAIKAAGAARGEPYLSLFEPS